MLHSLLEDGRREQPRLHHKVVTNRSIKG
jgi:hypothetical protein